MKVVFAGPSLWGATPNTADIVMKGPAGAGDVLSAVRDGATVIGLVDGFFGWTASTWHKEILLALTEGVTVFGAASIGALRAAELHQFGMVPIGGIAADYVAGILDDDAAVALTSGPAELHYMPLSEPLVDVVATIKQMARVGAIGDGEASHLERCARAIFFQRRTVDEIVGKATQDEALRTRWRTSYELNRVFRKRDDALVLVEAVRLCGTEKQQRTTFLPSAFWPLLEPLTPD